MKDPYPAWRQKAIEAARFKVRADEIALNTLKDKNSTYARTIAAVIVIQRKALEVYENSPETLGKHPLSPL